jgi:hypothetical protein
MDTKNLINEEYTKPVSLRKIANTYKVPKAAPRLTLHHFDL